MRRKTAKARKTDRPRADPSVTFIVEAAVPDCAARFKDVPCVLYAVNDRVEFGSK